MPRSLRLSSLRPLLLGLLVAAAPALSSCTEDIGEAPLICPADFVPQGGRCVLESPIQLSPVQIGPATVGRPFFVQLTAEGGAAPYRFTLLDGALPPGLSLSPAGAMSGTPTTPGASAFTLQATDAAQERGAATWTLEVAAAIGCSAERCDGVDNDCDGITDESPEDLIGFCGPEDACTQGTLVCAQGEPLCEGIVARREEVCDTLDNDCDGTVDEGGVCEGDCAAQPCIPGESECVDANNTRVCALDANGCGQWGASVACAAACANATCEACGDIDGDGRGVGCAAGSDCNEEDPTIYRNAPETCDSTDNDCDGAVDEGGACTLNCDADACVPGTTRCANAANVQTCARDGMCGVWAAPTRCDRGCADGSCRGCTDNDNDGHGPGCEAGNDCLDSNPLVFNGAPELCDQLDNNCNGSIDEGGVCDDPNACLDDGFEENDTAAQGTPLEQQTTRSARSCGQGDSADQDWFDLGDLFTGQSADVELSFTPGACSLRLELYQDGTRVATGDAGNGGSRIDQRVIVPGRFSALVVADLNSPAGCDYTLRRR